VRGSGLWCDPWSARPSPAALGRRRPHGVGQPGAVMPLSSPVPPSRRAHRHRTRRRSDRHRPGRPSTEPGIAGAPTNWTPARGGALPRTYRRARRLVVVSTLPTPTTTDQQLAWLPQPVTTGTVSKLKHVGASNNSFTLPGCLPRRAHRGRQPNPHRHRPADPKTSTTPHQHPR